MVRKRRGSRDSAVEAAAADFDALFNPQSLNVQDQSFLAEQALLDAVEQERTPTRSSVSATLRRSSLRAPSYELEEGEYDPYDPSNWEAIASANGSSRSSSASARRRAAAMQYSPSMPAWSPSNRNQRFAIPYDPNVPLYTVAPARPRRRPSIDVLSPMLYDPQGYLHRSVSAVGGGEPSPGHDANEEDDDESFLQPKLPLSSLADLHARIDRAFAGMADEQVAIHERLDDLFNRFDDRIARLEALVRNLLDFGRPNLHTVYSETSEESSLSQSSTGSKRKRSSSSASAKRVSFQDFEEEEFIDEEANEPASPSHRQSRNTSSEPASPRKIASPRTPPSQRDRTPSRSPSAQRKGSGSASGDKGSPRKKPKTTAESPAKPSHKIGSDGLPAPATPPKPTSTGAVSPEPSPKAKTPSPPRAGPAPVATMVAPRRSQRLRDRDRR